MAGVIVFNCPDDALYVILMDALVGCRVDILKLFMQCMVSVLVSKVVKALSVRLIHILLCEINVIQKRLYIKAGAADNYRYLSCFVYFIKCFFGHILKDKYIELVRGLKFIYQIVLYAVHLIDCNLRRAYIHVFVYLHGIRGYYSTIYFFCKLNR